MMLIKNESSINEGLTNIHSVNINRYFILQIVFKSIVWILKKGRKMKILLKKI